MIYPLGDLADVHMGFPFRSRLKDEAAGPVAVVQMKDLSESNEIDFTSVLRIKLTQVPDRQRLRAGDLVFRSRGRRNQVALVREVAEQAVLAAPMLLIRCHAVQPDYLRWFINSPSVQAELMSHAKGTSVLMIDAESLRGIKVPVPNERRQRQIAQIAELARTEHRLMEDIRVLRLRSIEGALSRAAKDSGATQKR